LLDKLSGVVHMVPGNQDASVAMLHEFAGTPYVQAAPGEPDRCYFRVDLPGLTLLCCDNSVRG